ncbi:MAG TPA: GrpB family protein [Polyangiaceae bacterium]|jgi:GrpB-like predicted nucleotidyltransferase (UPF0157 family)
MSNPSRASILVPYDPAWPSLYAAEARRIGEVLEAIALRIDHNGSTSVPGLCAKPIIDIQVSVASLEPLSAYRDPFERLGYTHLRHDDDSFAPFFFRPHGGPHSHHVHVVRAGGDEERRTLAFQDYLRANPEVARDYAALKLRLAEQYGYATASAREAYAIAKGPFVEAVLKAAQNSSAPFVTAGESNS